MQIPENQALEHRVHKKLQETLSDTCSEHDVAQLFQALWQVDDVAAFRAISGRLLRQGVDVSLLLECLLYCEMTYMQYVSEVIHPDSLLGKSHELSTCTQAYHAAKCVLFAEVEEQWHARLQEKSICQQLREQKAAWLHDGEIELHNYFYEMPVRAKFKLLDVEDDALTVLYDAASAMVFVASSDSKSAYLAISNRQRLLVRGVERKGRKLRLVIEDCEDDQVSKREYVRVAMPNLIPIVLRTAKQDIAAEIADVSHWGVGVVFSKGLGIQILDDASLVEGDEVSCCWEVDGHAWVVPSVVRWVKKLDGDVYRGGLETKPDSAMAHEIHQWMMQYQRQAMMQLRTMNMPPWLRDTELDEG